jgi:hypothetical protein
MCRGDAAALLGTGRRIKTAHIYKVRPRKDKRGVDLISDALPFGRLWYEKPNDAIGYAKASQPIT